MSDVSARNVVVVNGYKVFHLATLSEELDRAARLHCLVTGAYPYLRLKKLLKFFERFTNLAARLRTRQVHVSEERIEACWLGECLNYLGVAYDHKGWRRTYEFLNGRSIDIMSRRAARILGQPPDRPKILYVRSGFGGAALRAARSRGDLTICDQSIAHPRIIEGLIRENGNLDSGNILQNPTSDIWRRAADDLSLCDHVLVNSDFVKSTFAMAGARTDNVHVVYLGIDQQFMNFIASAQARGKCRRTDGPVSMLFAGGITLRKGIANLSAAMAKIRDVDCHLKIAGALGTKDRPHIAGLAADPRVAFLGARPRDSLAELMCMSEIFIFPSLAEGSAKVIFEAMAAGCFIITTPNSGSIVRDGIHGFVVPAGDADALADAVRRAAGNRAGLAEIGARNAQIIASGYSQDHYGRQVTELFDSLVPRERINATAA